MRKKLASAVVLFCCTFLFVSAQPITGDSTPLSIPLKNTIAVYYKTAGENAHLFSGSEYAGYNVNLIGHPYFDSIDMEPGSIVFDGILYGHIMMLYDINNDEVIINKYDQNFKIRLPGEKISYFSILGNEFVRIVPDSANKNKLDIGFYHRIYNGKTVALVKRKKIIEDLPIINNELKTQFRQLNYYYIKKNNTYYEVNSMSAVFKLFKDQGKDKEVKRYLKKNKIRLKNISDNAVVQAVQYYDQLTN